MFHLQVISGEQYQNDYTYSIVNERTLNSSRGNIYDRNGKLLAYNELAYTITIEDNGSYDSTKDKNKQLNVSELARVCHLSRTTVYKYIDLLEKWEQGAVWLPVYLFIWL